MELIGHGAVLEGAVRDWVERELPGEPGLAARAAVVAASAYEHGATVGEACREAHSLVRSWCRHPAHPRQGAAARLAS